MRNDDDDLLEFVDEGAPSSGAGLDAEPWRVLIVDDEPGVHEVTRLALGDYEFMGRRLEFCSAHSEAEARRLLAGEAPFVLIFLDVVMETSTSGLDLVRFIRDDLRNDMIQIILRTGQPGEAPEEKVVKELRINDYKLKTDLTRDKLFSVVSLSLRAYDQCRRLSDLSAKVMEANEALARANSSLEEQVAHRTKELVEKSHDLEEALGERRNLLRIMAHDLRNYLTIVLGYSRQIMDGKGGSNIARAIDRIHWAAGSQSELIERVIELEATSGGRGSLNTTAVRLEGLVEHSVKAFDEKLAAKSLTLAVVWKCDQAVSVLVEPRSFRHSVLNNLISNAIKFSEPGSCIRLGIEQSDESTVLITVRDHGIGMPPAVVSALFSLDKKASRLGTQGERGTGFGMPIVKSLVERMGGAITVNSTEKTASSEDHGTTVVISLRPAA